MAGPGSTTNLERSDQHARYKGHPLSGACAGYSLAAKANERAGLLLAELGEQCSSMPCQVSGAVRPASVRVALVRPKLDDFENGEFFAVGPNALATGLDLTFKRIQAEVTRCKTDDDTSLDVDAATDRSHALLQERKDYK
jgi:hypothetical protein